jgi:hypothetical protein
LFEFLALHPGQKPLESSPPISENRSVTILVPATGAKLSYGRQMMTDSAQLANSARKFRVGPLGTLNQVLTANAKVIRAMASGEIDSHLGARLSNAISIQRQIIEAIMTERLEQRLLTVEEALVGRISAHHEARHGDQSLPH